MSSLQRIGGIISIVAGAVSAAIGIIQMLFWITYWLATASISDTTLFNLILSSLGFITSTVITILGAFTISAKRSGTAWGLIVLSIIGPFGLVGLVAVVAVAVQFGFETNRLPFLFITNLSLMVLMVLSLIGGIIAIVGVHREVTG